jgi:uncharacterized membrane protein YkoI
MSLQRETIFQARGSRLLLIVAAAVIAVPCAVAAALAVGSTLGPMVQTSSAQEPSREYKEGKEMGEKEARRKQDRERVEREMKERGESDPQFKAELEERSRRERLELEAKATMQAALVNLAKIPMDQAIQIATSSQPGKVLSCSLVGEHWEAPGKLAKDGMVLYHTVIISGDETNPVTTHVLINAFDGTVIKVEKEERGKERRRAQSW